MHALFAPLGQLTPVQAWWIGGFLYLVGGVLLGRRAYWRAKAHDLTLPKDEQGGLGCGVTLAVVFWPVFLVLGLIIGIIQLPPRDQRKP